MNAALTPPSPPPPGVIVANTQQIYTHSGPALRSIWLPDRNRRRHYTGTITIQLPEEGVPTKDAQTNDRFKLTQSENCFIFFFKK